MNGEFDTNKNNLNYTVTK